MIAKSRKHGKHEGEHMPIGKKKHTEQKWTKFFGFMGKTNMGKMEKHGKH